MFNDENPRKPRSQQKRQNLHIRVTKLQLSIYKQAAKLAGMTLSEWTRQVILDAIKRPVLKSRKRRKNAPLPRSPAGPPR